jgi:hypothetical protein
LQRLGLQEVLNLAQPVAAAFERNNVLPDREVSLLEAVSKFGGECSSIALARLGNENSARMNADHEDFPVMPWSV